MKVSELATFGRATMVVVVPGKNQKGAIACKVFGMPNRNSLQGKQRVDTGIFVQNISSRLYPIEYCPANDILHKFFLTKNIIPLSSSSTPPFHGR